MKSASLAVAFVCLLLVGCKPRQAVSPTVPRRIVSVTITGDVLVQALVDSSRVLAVSALADDSGIHEAAGLFPGKTRVGADLEKIVSLRPDLVLIGSFHDPAFRDGILRSGIPYAILSNPNSFEKVRSFLKETSSRIGEGPKGDSLVRWMDSILASVQERAKKCPDHPRVLYWSEGYTAGDSSTIGAMFQLLGLRNAAQEIGLRGSKPIAIEDVVKLDPDWILRSGWEAGGAMKPLPKALDGLRAVKAGRIAVVPGKLLLSTSHRIALGADSLSRAIRSSCP